MAKDYEVACYHWSNWHPTENNDKKRGKGWTEWEYLKQAIPRFPGHQQPKYPLWGYLDDSKMENVERQIDTASSYGIDAFIFDWHFISPNNDVIDQFIQAPNKMKMKFGMMLCGPEMTYEQTVDMFDYVIEKYFSQPNYWKVDGGCYFSVYEFGKMIPAWGGMSKAKELMDLFRKKATDKGLKLHLVAVEWGLQNLYEDTYTAQDLVRELGIDAITSYVWAHNTVPAWPYGDYSDWAESAYNEMLKIEDSYDVPYYTHVSMGWDPSPRCPANMVYEDGGPLMYHTLTGEVEILWQPYFSSIIQNNTPAEFRRALIAAKRHMDDTKQKNKIVTLYAWNEWTEGGYLEPDSVNGYGYLEAIKEIFTE